MVYVSFFPFLYGIHTCLWFCSATVTAADVIEVVAVEHFKIPDLLEEDRKNREVDTDLAFKMIKHSQKYKSQMKHFVRDSDIIAADVDTELKERDDMVDEVLDTEAGVTSTAIANELEYAGNFRVHAANIMMNTLLKIHLEVIKRILKSQAKIYFRYRTKSLLIEIIKYGLQRCDISFSVKQLVILGNAFARQWS